jgi:hypothetical protein
MTTKNEPRLLVAHAVANDAPVPRVWFYEDVMKVLRCSKRTLETLVSRDEIPHKEVGGRIVFYPPVIDEWLRTGDWEKGKARAKRR